MTSQSGFSLLETLVALTVLSVGLLGASALLLSALREQRQALDHAAATALVADAAGRLRAGFQASLLHADAPVAASAALSGDGCASGCDAAALAAHDLAQWEQAARMRFPHGRPQAALSFEPATGPAMPGRYLISLRWSDAQDEVAVQEVPLTVIAKLPVAG